MNLTIFGDSFVELPDIRVGIILAVLAILSAVGLPCGVICRVIMRSKGYAEPFKWFLLGFFLNIIGLIICLYKSNNVNMSCHQDMLNQPVQENSLDIRCTSCGALNPPDAQCCMQCGKKLY